MASHRTPVRLRRGARYGAALGLAGALGAGVLLSGGPVTPRAVAAAPAAASLSLPRGNASFDYQLGGAYKPSAAVKVLSRDRSDRPVAGAYTICYVNGFQAQPEQLKWWQRKHPDLLLRDARGRLVIDKDWNEALLDTSTAAKRTRLASVVGAWIDGCSRHGFKAIEPDNLDSYARSKGLLTRADNVALATLLARRAHARGLAIGQKNSVELIPKAKRIGFDFAVAEECGRYDECGEYVAAYGSRVFVIEYRARDFAKACAAWGKRLSIVQRNLDLRPRGASGYLRKAC
ncbi:endo alpha-1,4 polygalactosaminidase [Streptomyces sp. NPDC089919]|uniref:endo alpha-1,4 polygalactosaminidase n=1 Tax=Streptomyces sp. NPDC089919 TaxID=3155188 RepID=UPI0034314C53